MSMGMDNHMQAGCREFPANCRADVPAATRH
jgi:hypothetical protein